MANRGRYIAVAAPGVDILSLAPGGAYQLSSGTSIAAAHVSGIAAMLLERNPSLRPSDIRSTLIATARQIGPPTPDSDFGAGLANAYRAVTWLDRAPPARRDASPAITARGTRIAIHAEPFRRLPVARLTMRFRRYAASRALIVAFRNSIRKSGSSWAR
jgi:subtilisin family serine protease